MTRVFIRWIIRLSCPSIHRPNSPGQVELKLRIGTVEWIVGKTRQALHSSFYKAPHQHAPQTHPHNRKNNSPLTTDQVLILSNKKKRRIYISPFAGIHLRIIIGLWCVVERTREPQTLPSLPPTHPMRFYLIYLCISYYSVYIFRNGFNGVVVFPLPPKPQVTFWEHESSSITITFLQILLFFLFFFIAMQRK